MLLASTIPNCIAYDATFNYELAVILHHGLQRMFLDKENVFFYVTVMNENYPHPALQPGTEEGILRGMYLLEEGPSSGPRLVQLLGTGADPCTVHVGRIVPCMHRRRQPHDDGRQPAGLAAALLLAQGRRGGTAAWGATAARAAARAAAASRAAEAEGGTYEACWLRRTCRRTSCHWSVRLAEQRYANIVAHVRGGERRVGGEERRAQQRVRRRGRHPR